MSNLHATGKRKRAVATVFLSPGKGTIQVNKKAFEAYFPCSVARKEMTKALELTEVQGQHDLSIKVSGGGTSGQQGAIRLAISRLMVAHNPAIRATLAAEKLLTRDARVVESKQYGRKKARKKPQFSKR